MEKDARTINISSVTVLKVLFIALLVWFLFAIREIVLLFIISMIVSAALDPIADFFAKYKIPRGISVLIVYILFLGLFVLVGYLLIPSIIEQFQSVQGTGFVSTLNEKIGPYRDSLARFGVDKSINSTIEHFKS